ncbi:hypothetical protein EJ110_NYTH46399 [Nymphaea thermarum]|nr:hypothetical protein EJ110_NYTH46399 [Nymphaea thermarum]
MPTWPLFAEQHLNEKLVEQILGTGVKVENVISVVAGGGGTGGRGEDGERKSMQATNNGKELVIRCEKLESQLQGDCERSRKLPFNAGNLNTNQLHGKEKHLNCCVDVE